MATRKCTNERSCITVLFSKKFKPSETNDPNAKKMTPLWPLGIMKKNVFAIVRVKQSYAHARICQLVTTTSHHHLLPGSVKYYYMYMKNIKCHCAMLTQS